MSWRCPWVDDTGMDITTKGQDTMTTDTFNAEWAAHKNAFAAREADQERAAFLSDPDLAIDAEADYLRNYTGTFAFLTSVRDKTVAVGRDMTPGQRAAVRKCMNRDNDRRNAPVAAAANPVTEPGIYRDGDTVYKVQRSRQSGNLYAKVLRDLNPGQGDRLNDDNDRVRFEFEYAPGAVFRLTADMRMTEADARDFGLRYGVCANCGRHLKVAESVERGIGPVCIKWFRW